MNKFRYTLGWAAMTSLLIFITGVIAVVFLGEDPILLARIFWLPFVFLWGLREVRIYRHFKGDRN